MNEESAGLLTAGAAEQRAGGQPGVCCFDSLGAFRWWITPTAGSRGRPENVENSALLGQKRLTEGSADRGGGVD